MQLVVQFGLTNACLMYKYVHSGLVCNMKELRPYLLSTVNY